MKEENKEAKQVLNKTEEVLAKTSIKAKKIQFIVTYETDVYVRPIKRKVLAYTRDEAETQVRHKLDALKAEEKIQWHKIISVEVNDI